jgi:hypothetical protein
MWSVNRGCLTPQLQSHQDCTGRVAYPQPKEGSRRKAPFLPYLAYAPPDFALMLRFAGGGMLANGKFMFDADGNLWSGQNWMPGSQSGRPTSSSPCRISLG